MSDTLPMTPARRAALVIGAPLLLLTIGWTALTGAAWAGQGSYPVRLDLAGRYRVVNVEVDAGQVALGPGPAGRLRLRGVAHYALTRPSVNWRRTTAGVAVNSRCRQLAGPCAFGYRISVPPGQCTTASVHSGSLAAAHLAGPVTLTSSSGRISAWALSGDAVLDDGSGPITGSGIASPRLTATDHSGDIVITGLTSGVVTATDYSGGITLAFSGVPDSVTLSDISGNIRIVLPPGATAYRIRVRALSGRAVVAVPTSSSSPHVIAVTARSGDVTITR